MARAATLRVPTVRPSTCRVASRRACHAVPSAVARCDVSSLRANHARRSVSWCITPHRSVRTRAARDETNSRPELTEETKPSSKTTISALDALLGSAAAREEEMETDTPKPVVADEKRKNDEKNTRDAKATVSTPPSSVRAALQRNLDGDEGKRGQTSYDEKSPIEMYDPEFDPLSLGPRWVVPWGGPTVLLTLLAVESGFYFAGALAPAIVYSNTRAPGEIPLDDPDAFAKDLQNVFDDPKSFADIIVVAEVVQTIFALSVVWAVANSKSPLPPGWFQFSVFGDDIDVDAGFPLDESERIKAKGGVDAGTTPASKELASKKRKAMSAQRVKSNDWFGEALRAMGLTWLLVGLITWLAYAVGLRGDDLGSSSNGVIEKGFAAGPGGAASLFLTTVVLAPVLEETVFRGFLLPSLTKWMGTGSAVVVSTVIFALVHEHNTGDTAQLLAVGAMAGVSYSRTRNLAASIAVHASFNLIVLVLFALWTRS